jgi:hypothetical protein
MVKMSFLGSAKNHNFQQTGKSDDSAVNFGKLAINHMLMPT